MCNALLLNSPNLATFIHFSFHSIHTFEYTSILLVSQTCTDTTCIDRARILITHAVKRRSFNCLAFFLLLFSYFGLLDRYLALASVMTVAVVVIVAA